MTAVLLKAQVFLDATLSLGKQFPTFRWVAVLIRGVNQPKFHCLNI